MLRRYGEEYLTALDRAMLPSQRRALPDRRVPDTACRAEWVVYCKSSVWQLRRAAMLGPHSQRWAEAMLHHRGIEGARVLMPDARMETAQHETP